MKTFLNYAEFVEIFETFELDEENKNPPDIGLFSKGGRRAIKGTGYVDKEKAESSCKKLDALEKKGEHQWAMSIATTMMNRATKHEHQTEGMRDAIKVYKEWIEKNRTT